MKYAKPQKRYKTEIFQWIFVYTSDNELQYGIKWNKMKELSKNIMYFARFVYIKPLQRFIRIVTDLAALRRPRKMHIKECSQAQADT